MNNNLTNQDIEKFSEKISHDSLTKITRKTVTKNGINNSCIDEELMRSLKNAFSVNVEAGNVCNQKHSGRCWMFAGLNVLRTILIKKFNVKNFELSQAYLQFYDKLEKANFFLTKAIELADEPVDSKLNVFMLDTGIGDGGHFVMFTNLVKKYGVVPIEEMPDLAVSIDTTELNNVLSHYLAQGMFEIRTNKEKGAALEELNNIKEKYLADIYKILVVSIGVPPTSFTYEYLDKDNKKQTLDTTTPVEFYNKYIAQDLDDYICLCDAPIFNMEEYVKYTCKYVNNVVGGDPVVFFNVPLSVLKEASIKSLEDGEVIWFAADVLAQSLRKEGYLVDGIINTNDLFNIDYKLTKGERLTYRTSFCNHAMTFTGVNLDSENKPNRWKVENSWGKDNGKDGFYLMSDKWFDEYVYEVFINKKYVPEEILEKYNKAKLVEQEPGNTLYKFFD